MFGTNLCVIFVRREFHPVFEDFAFVRVRKKTRNFFEKVAFRPAVQESVFGWRGKIMVVRPKVIQIDGAVQSEDEEFSVSSSSFCDFHQTIRIVFDIKKLFEIFDVEAFIVNKDGILLKFFEEI